MPVTYKDFDKDAKDLLTKKFQDGWKLEAKAKGPKEQFYINPVVDKGIIALDVQYDFADGTKTKVTIDQDGQLKDKITYTQGPNTLEVTAGTRVGGSDCFQKWDVEATYERKQGALNIKNAVTYAKGSTNSTVGIVYDVAPAISVGLGLGFALTPVTLKDLSAGIRYAQKGIFGSAVYNKNGTVTVAAKYPVAVADRTVVVAAQAVHKVGGSAPDVTVGIETGCLLVKGATTKLKYNQKTGVSFAWIKRMNDFWELAITAVQSKDSKAGVKFGVLLTRE